MSAFITSSPEAHAEPSVDVIGNLEALLRDDDEETSNNNTNSAVDNSHFFVVSTAASPSSVTSNAHCVLRGTNSGTITAANGASSLNSAIMNTSATPFQPLRSPTGGLIPSFAGLSTTPMVGAPTNAMPMPMGMPMGMGGMMGMGMVPQRHGMVAPLMAPANVSVVVGNDGLFSSAPTFTPYAPVHLNMPTQPRTSTLRDNVRAGFINFEALKSYTLRHYAVIVNNLDPRTQSKHLMSIFFPLGAVDALAFQSPVGNEEMGQQYAGRKGGIVLFTSSEMATMAASKIDDFVPHGQTLPLHTTFFGRYEEDYLPHKATFTMTRPSAVAASPFVAAGPNGNGSYEAAPNSMPTSPTTGGSNAAPTAGGADTQQLINVFVAAVSSTPEEADRAVDALISRFVKDPARRAVVVITVCAAIQAQQDALPHAQAFLRGVSKFCIQNGLMNPTTERPIKLACGAICGAMFALQIVRGNPFGMALRIATEFLKVNANATTSDGEDGNATIVTPLDAAQTTTLEALLAMGASWRARADASATAIKEEVEVSFDAIVSRLSEEGRYNPTPSTPTTAANVKHEDLSPVPTANTSAEEVGAANTAPNNTSADVNVSAVSEARSVGSFQVSATPVRGGAPNATHHASMAHRNNMSVESNTSSLGPLLTASALQTPEKLDRRTTLSMDTSVLSNASNVGGSTAAANPLLSGLHAHHQQVNGMLASMANGMAPMPMVLPNGAVGMPMPMIVPPQAVGASNAFMNALAAQEGSNLRQHLMASTVYMTKVPLSLPHATLRKLFDCFGEFNKVRIYEEKKGANSAATCNGHAMTAGTMVGGMRAGATTQNSFNNRGNFGFVEFVVPASSKAMVDFFRNPTSVVQVRMGISKAEMDAILTMRVSFARSCIHDHDNTDALFDASELMPADADSPGRKIKSCTFGLE